MKLRAFTLIEVVIVIAIIGILLALFINFERSSGQGSGISYGLTGMVETRCIEHYKFLVGHDGRVVQILNNRGEGITC